MGFLHRLTISLAFGLTLFRCEHSKVTNASQLKTPNPPPHTAFSPKPTLLNKILIQKSILSPLGVLPFSKKTRLVSRKSFENSVEKAVTSSLDHSRDFWQESVAIALSQVNLDHPLNSLDFFESAFLKTNQAEDFNIFKNTREATYIAANQILAENRSVDLGVFSSQLDGFILEVTPKDLMKSYLLKCQQNLCQASFLKSAVIKRSIPINLQANIDLVFSKSFDPKTTMVSYEVGIDGNWTTLHLGQILAISISMGIDALYTPNSSQITLRNPRCAVDVSCDLTVAKFSANFSHSGMTFNASSQLGPYGDRLIKMAPYQGHFSKHISMENISKCLKENLKNLPASRGDEDIFWDDLLAK